MTWLIILVILLCLAAIWFVNRMQRDLDKWEDLANTPYIPP